MAELRARLAELEARQGSDSERSKVRASELAAEVARLQDALARTSADAASRKQAVELLSAQVPTRPAAALSARRPFCL
jgi:hypothetical protein